MKSPLHLACIASVICAACQQSERRTTPFPPVGLSVRDTAGDWCSMFQRDSMIAGTRRSLAVGDRVTLVFADTADIPSVAGTIRARRSAPCPTVFPQPRWIDYVAYDLAIRDTTVAIARTVALIVASDVGWQRTATGEVQADLDGDGSPEEARRCAADEGEHFTIWSRDSTGTWRRRAHEYFDWGVIVDPTCRDLPLDIQDGVLHLGRQVEHVR